ncbi:MAG: cytochrome b [Zoogloeaceae bacterium]|nr:cytochrome b [Zoogloeaceae bacterium]
MSHTQPGLPTHYTRTAILLHWLMALMIIAMFGLGLYMTGLKLSPQKLQLYSWHKWAGVSVFVLAAFRLVWRLTHTPPPHPAGMPRWQQIAANGTHHLLYLLMIAIPLSGWLMSSAKGFQTVWFGVLPLPDLLAKDKALGDLLQGVHQALNLGLATLVLAHIAAAIKHHLVERDGVLARMLPFLQDKR